jgi:peptidyl-prolyl cis-trans isomerase SurA
LNVKSLIPDAAAAKDYIMSKVNPLVEKTLVDYNEHELLKNNPEYRNLLNEYRDGMLLFEISNDRVWKAANRDTVGLERHFAEHRANYTWDEPHFKGIILSAVSDSVMQLVKADITKYGRDTLPDMMHMKYGNDIRMERMVVKKGENALADYLAFGVADKPVQQNSKFTEYMILEGGIINQPEEMADVRGAVTSDYQDELERLWKEELARKYPAKVNKKVLKKLK